MADQVPFLSVISKNFAQVVPSRENSPISHHSPAGVSAMVKRTRPAGGTGKPPHELPVGDGRLVFDLVALFSEGAPPVRRRRRIVGHDGERQVSDRALSRPRRGDRARTVDHDDGAPGRIANALVLMKRATLRRRPESTRRRPIRR